MMEGHSTFILEDQRQLNVPFMSNNQESGRYRFRVIERYVVYFHTVSVLEWSSP